MTALKIRSLWPRRLHQWMGAVTVGMMIAISSLLVQAAAIPVADASPEDKVGEEIPISVAINPQGEPAGAYNASANEYLVVWADYRNGADYNIYGQRVRSDGTLDPQGNFVIANNAGHQIEPHVTYNPTNNEYLVVWRRALTTGFSPQIEAQRVSASGVLLDNPGTAADESSPGTPFLIYTWPDAQSFYVEELDTPDVGFSSDAGGYLVVWQKHHYHASGAFSYILAKQILGDGTLLDNPNTAQDETDLQQAIVFAEAHPDAFGYSMYSGSVIYNATSKEWFVTWDDEAASIQGIYGQRVTPAGMFVEGRALLASGSTKDNPRTVWNPTRNEYLLVWRIRDSYSSPLKARRVSSEGAGIGGEIDLSSGAYQYEPELAYDPASRQYLVVWEQGTPRDIYGRRISDDGVPLASSFAIVISAASKSTPDLTYNSTSREFLVVWQDARNGDENRDIYGQRYKIPDEPAATQTPTRTPTRTPTITRTPISTPTIKPGPTPMPTATPTATPHTCVSPQWTFLVYLNGDNNLDFWTYNLFNRLESAANNSCVEVLVLWDRSGVNDTVLYWVQHDDRPYDLASYVDNVNRWPRGELNMGDPQTLIDFVTSMRAAHPNPFTFLTLVDHGNGWSPSLPPAAKGYPHGGMSFDDTSGGSYLTTSNLETAFGVISGNGSDPIDVVYYDACLMSMIENAHPLRDFVSFLIAAQNESFSSYPYDEYVWGIDETTQPADLAEAVVEVYHESLPSYPRTMTALNLAHMTSVSAAVDALARAFQGQVSLYKTQLATTFASTQRFDSNLDLRLNSPDAYVDLYHFAKLIKQNIPDATVRTAAQGVMDAIGEQGERLILKERHASGVYWGNGAYWGLDNARGLSIYLPLGETDWLLDYYNRHELSFAADTAWDEFIREAVNAAQPPFGPTPVPLDPGERPGPLTSGHKVYLPLVIRG